MFTSNLPTVYFLVTVKELKWIPTEVNARMENPYQVLGVDENATESEIKKAYHRKAKEYHPDLHPDDPVAAKKMIEVNEAYEMLMNPEKNVSASAKTTSSTRDRGETDRQRETQDAYGFDFWEFFHFDQSSPSELKVESEDSEVIAHAIDLIRRSAFLEAIALLDDVPGYKRNARWFYVGAVANQRLGRIELAFEKAKRAVELEPYREDYKYLYRVLYQQLKTSSAERRRPRWTVGRVLWEIVKLFLWIGFFELIFRLMFRF